MLSAQKVMPATAEAYASSLERNGEQLVPGGEGTFWAEYESFAMMRIPYFSLTPPSPEEVKKVLWQSRRAVASYLLPPDKSHPANAWLYACRDRAYSLENLNVAGRRDARRASRNLRIDFIDWPTVFRHGFAPYSHSRQRIGLSDGTRDHFRKRFERFSCNPSHCAIGAWKDDILVAFMSLIIVDDCVAIEGAFSDDRYRTLCPSDGLANFVLQYFLRENDFNMVSYGLSSIQEAAHSGGLHAHKKKVGFEAEPVHRAFVLHPLLRPLGNQLTLHCLNVMSGFFPRNRLVKKAGGMLATLLGHEWRAEPQ